MILFKENKNIIIYFYWLLLVFTTYRNIERKLIIHNLRCKINSICLEFRALILLYLWLSRFLLSLQNYHCQIFLTCFNKNMHWKSISIWCTSIELKKLFECVIYSDNLFFHLFLQLKYLHKFYLLNTNITILMQFHLKFKLTSTAPTENFQWTIFDSEQFVIGDLFVQYLINLFSNY